MKLYNSTTKVLAEEILSISAGHGGAVLILADESEVKADNSFLVLNEPQPGHFFIKTLNTTMPPGLFHEAFCLPEPEPEPEPEPVKQVDATDHAFQLAEESGVDLADIEGTGKDGKITVTDVREHLK